VVLILLWFTITAKHMRISSKNSKKDWLIHFMIYPSKKKGWYTAVCLELSLIREGNDFFKLRQQINKLAARYIDSIQKNGLDDKLLNQKLPKQYVERFKLLIEQEKAQQLKEKWEKIVRAIVWEQRIKERRASITA